MAFADAGTEGIVISTGLQSSPFRVTLASDVVTGDILGISSNTWVLAFGNQSGVIQGDVVALENGTSGDLCNVSRCPTISGRYSGGTAGGYVYVSEATSGEVETTAPDTGSDADTIIGIVLDATTIKFFLQSRVDSTV